MGKNRRANMAITTVGDRLRKQRLTRQERQFSVNRGAEKFIERDTSPDISEVRSEVNPRVDAISAREYSVKS